MTVLIIPPNGEPYAGEVGENVADLQDLVGGYIETVVPMMLPRQFRLVVNDAFLLDRLPFNEFASFLYGVLYHGQVILGNCVVLCEGINKYGEGDLVGLTDNDVKAILNLYRSFH